MSSPLCQHDWTCTNTAIYQWLGPYSKLVLLLCKNHALSRKHNCDERELDYILEDL